MSAAQLLSAQRTRVNAARPILERLALRVASARSEVARTDAMEGLQRAFRMMYKAAEYAPLCAEMQEVAMGTRTASNSSGGGGGGGSSSSSSSSSSDIADE
jgi:hypothetical protein